MEAYLTPIFTTVAIAFAAALILTAAGKIFAVKNEEEVPEVSEAPASEPAEDEAAEEITEDEPADGLTAEPGSDDTPKGQA